MPDFSSGLKGIFAPLGFCFYFVEKLFLPQFRSICLCFFIFGSGYILLLIYLGGYSKRLIISFVMLNHIGSQYAKHI
jgi:hypothetical protein